MYNQLQNILFAMLKDAGRGRHVPGLVPQGTWKYPDAKEEREHEASDAVKHNPLPQNSDPSPQHIQGTFISGDGA